jgi:multiple sugar transport system permease protein
MLKGFFDNVPYAIEEAQMCDGPRGSRPSSRSCPGAPGVGAFLVLCVLFAWNDFLFASIIGSGGAKTLPVATRSWSSAEHPVGQHHMAAGVSPPCP